VTYTSLLNSRMNSLSERNASSESLIQKGMASSPFVNNVLPLLEETNLHYQSGNTVANASLSVTNNIRLPRELLIEIFHYIVPVKSDGTRVTHICHACGRREHLCNMKRWMPAIAHVCHFWRTVALSTPSLWVQCMPPTLDGMRAFSNRSANLSMDLEISFGQPREYVDFMLSQLQRAKGLHVELDCYCMDKITAVNVLELERLISLQSMPRSLEYLRIGGMNSTRGINIPTKIAMMCLPPEIAEDRFPKLRHVYLCWFPIEWGCGLLRRLRTLIIDGIGWQAYLTPNQLYEILEDCPEIENLGISQVAWRFEAGVPKVDSPLHLSHLRLARLDFSHPSIILDVLHRVSFPVEAHIWLTSGIQPAVNNSVTGWVRAIAPLLKRGGLPLWQLGIIYDKYRAGIYGSVSGSKGD
jgi:hypothetical protein